jgi:hypothetical protein
MGQIEQLHERLLSASALLDTAAGEIREVGLEPVDENIQRIGKALVEVLDILHTVYAVRSDLTPTELKLPPNKSGANKRLTAALNEAYALAGSNRITAAIAGLEAFALSELSAMHRGIAEHEVGRLKSRK